MNTLAPPKGNAPSFVRFDDRMVTVSGPTLTAIPSLSIACAPSCDFNCPHCIYNAQYNGAEPGMTSDEKTSLVARAAAHGCRFLQICHEGEPFCDPTTLPVLQEGARQGMRSFMFTHGALVTPEIAEELHRMGVCLGVKCDSMAEDVFNRMIAVPRAKDIYRGIQNLLDVGYGTPIDRDGSRYTRLSLVCTVTEINLQSVKDVARFCWDHNLFFNVSRLEKGGRANRVWERFRVKDPRKLRDLIAWCSEQTGIDYRYAQPDCYCIGASGLQVSHNGDVWMTKEGCGCDLTEPDGVTYPNTFVVGNVRQESLQTVVDRVWEYRRSILHRLEPRMQEYLGNLDSDNNILAACGGSRTHFLFRAYRDYVRRVLAERTTVTPAQQKSEESWTK